MNIDILKSIIAMLLCSPAFTASAQTSVSPAEARAIAKEAYIYGFPFIEYGYFVDSQNLEFKGAWNAVHNTPRVRRKGMSPTGYRLFQTKVGTSLSVSMVPYNRGSTRLGNPVILKSSTDSKGARWEPLFRHRHQLITPGIEEEVAAIAFPSKSFSSSK
jgi:hypothetical protein